MEKTLSNRKIVKQSNQLTTAKYKLTATEMKFIALTVAQIRMEDEGFDTYTIKVSELEDKLGAELNETRLKKFAKGLMSKPFEIPESNGDWTIFNWFSSIRYHNGQACFSVKIDDRLKPHLLKLQGHFTKYDLTSLARMNSVYSMRIYQMLQQHNSKQIFSSSLADLQEVMQVPKSFLRYDNFKRKVLEVAVKEINEKTDLFCTLREIKEGKKVVKIELSYKRKNEIKQFNEREFVGENITIYGDLVRIVEADESGRVKVIHHDEIKVIKFDDLTSLRVAVKETNEQRPALF